MATGTHGSGTSTGATEESDVYVMVWCSLCGEFHICHHSVIWYDCKLRTWAIWCPNSRRVVEARSEPA